MSTETRDPHNLEELLQRLEKAGEPDQPVTIGQLLEVAGERSFAVILLIPSLLVLSPLSGIPGLPSMFAVMIALIAVQLLIGRKHLWLPQWLLKRSASREKFNKAIRFLHHIARVVDRFLKRRLTFLTSGIAVRLNAVLCLLIACTMPPLDLIPFGNSTAGAALSALCLGLMARDGVLTLISIAFFCALVFFVTRVIFM